MAKKKAARKRARKAAPAPAPAVPAAPRPVDLAQAFRDSYADPPPLTMQAVTLDPDVAPHFRDARAVNEALRALLRIVKQVRS